MSSWNEEISIAFDDTADVPEDKWAQLTTDGGLLDDLKDFVAANRSHWDMVRQAWDTWEESYGNTYQWRAGHVLIHIAQQAAKPDFTADELQQVLPTSFDAADGLDPYPWVLDAFFTLRDTRRTPLRNTRRELSVLFAEGDSGVLAFLEVELIPDGSGKIYPDAQHNAFVDFDDTFQEAYLEAWDWAQEDAALDAEREELRRVDARFRLLRQDIPTPYPHNDPLKEVNGTSAQGAFYLCLLHAAKAYLPKKTSRLLTTSVAVTATLFTEDGQRRFGAVGGLREKILAAYLLGRSKIIVATEVEAEARQAWKEAEGWRGDETRAPEEMSDDSGRRYVEGFKNPTQAAKEIHAICIERHHPNPSEPQLAKKEDRDGLITLREKVKREWIENRLENRADSKGVLGLAKETRPDLVERVLMRPNQSSKLLSPDQNMRETFDEIGKFLLILGEPGGGKTFAMFQLASELIARGEKDSDKALPVPVYFHLSTWDGSQSLFDWLVDELNRHYDASKKWVRLCLKNNWILPLLDGLDEVRPEKQAACVEAINALYSVEGEDEDKAQDEEVAEDEAIHFPGLVVCCRLREYTALPVRLHFDGAICLQPLTLERVYEHLDQVGPKLSGLREVLEEDHELLFCTDSQFSRDLDDKEIPADLRQAFEDQDCSLSDNLTVEIEVPGNKWLVTDEDGRQYFTIQRDGEHLHVYDRNLQTLACTPLMLHIMSVAYEGLHAETIRHSRDQTQDDDQKRIFYTYIERMFEHFEDKGKDPPYKKPPTIRWLSWLAQNMKRYSQDIFLIEGLQPSWLSTYKQRWFYRFNSSLVNAFLGGLVTGLFFIFLVTTGSSEKTITSWLVVILFIFLIIGSMLVFVAIGEALLIPLDVLPDLISRRIGRRSRTPDGREKNHTAKVLNRLWTGSVRKLVAILIGVLLFGPAGGLIGEIYSGNQRVGLITGLGLGVFYGLFGSGLKLDYIRTAEVVNWSLMGIVKGIVKRIFKVLVGLLIWVLLAGLIGGIIGAFFGHAAKGAGYGVGIVILITPFVFLGALLDSPERSVVNVKEKVPNQGIHLTRKNAIRGGLIYGLIGGLISMVVWEVLRGVIVGLMIFIISSLAYGGIDVIRHYLLRYFLIRIGYTPRNYAHFLDYTDNLIFLRKVGGGYQFYHGLLRDHFAAKWQTDEISDKRKT
jgi:MFS family permease